MSDTRQFADSDLPAWDDEKFERDVAALRETLAGAADPRQDVKNALDDDDELVNKIVAKVLPAVDERFRKNYYLKIMIAVGILITIVVIACALAFDRIASVAAINAETNTNQDASIQRSEQTIQAFKDQLRVANMSLVAQGLPPIAAPEGDVAPGSPEQAQLINASAAAKTLSELGNQTRQGIAPDSPPTVAKVIATEVTRQVQATQLQANPNQVIDAVGEYVRRNGLPQGPQGPQGGQGNQGLRGEQGLPGPMPSDAEIRSAFQQAVVDNPDVLCPSGEYGTRQVALANGGSTTQYGCFGEDRPPVTDPEPDPEPPQEPPATEEQAPDTGDGS